MQFEIRLATRQAGSTGRAANQLEKARTRQLSIKEQKSRNIVKMDRKPGRHNVREMRDNVGLSRVGSCA